MNQQSMHETIESDIISEWSVIQTTYNSIAVDTTINKTSISFIFRFNLKYIVYRMPV